MPPGVGTLADYAEDLLANVVDALETTPAKAPAERFVSFGIPAVDCEQVTTWVITLAPEQTGPGTPPPIAGHRQNDPGLLQLATFGILVTRCVPTPSPPRNPIPSADVKTAKARETNQDIWAIWNWLYWSARKGTLFGGECSEFYFDPPAPLAISGGFAGWTAQLRTRIDGYDPTI